MSTSFSAREASIGAPGWRLVRGQLHLTVDLGGFEEAMAFVDAVADIAQELNHHPDIDIRYSRVHLVVMSHDVGGLTDRDVRLAGRVSALLADLGAHPDNRRITDVAIVVDVTDAGAVAPFWAAVLGYQQAEEEGLVSDPDGIGPQASFRTGDSRTQPARVRLDVGVPHDEAQSRVERALAAGGRLVDDSAAPALWVLADAEGNEACISTWQDPNQGAHAKE